MMGSQPSFFHGILMLNFPTRPKIQTMNSLQDKKCIIWSEDKEEKDSKENVQDFYEEPRKQAMMNQTDTTTSNMNERTFQLAIP